MAAQQVGDSAVSAVVTDVLELSAGNLCQTGCCQVPDSADTGVTNLDFVALGVLDEVFQSVEAVVISLDGDGGCCGVDHHDGLELGVGQACIVAHGFQSSQLNSDHGQDGAVVLGVCAVQHTGSAACTGTVLDGDCLEAVLGCVSPAAHNSVGAAACIVGNDGSDVHLGEVDFAAGAAVAAAGGQGQNHDHGKNQCDDFLHCVYLFLIDGFYLTPDGVQTCDGYSAATMAFATSVIL